MKIDVAQITDYDSLSLEEKVAALENFEYDDHSDAVADLEKHKEATNKAHPARNKPATDAQV